MKIKAQVSLEYLLIIAGFFSVLIILVPAIISSVNAFESAQDTMLAQRISDKLDQTSRLFNFLGNGTIKKMSFTPVKSIFVWSEGKKVIVASESKQFEVLFEDEQVIPKQEFGDWIKYLGNNTLENHKKYVNTIGNFTLLGEKLNIIASNNPFEAKLI